VKLHLLHPALVHVSVAFLVVGGWIEAFGLLATRPAAARLGNALVLIGCASLLFTLASGYLAANSVVVPEEARGLLWAHERNGWLVLALFGAGVFWKASYRGVLPAGQARAYAVLLLLATLFVLYSAWLGAEMVYGHGVGVSARTSP
jgi:uncharacterized membrane protein